MAETVPASPDIRLFRDVFDASPIGIAVENLEGQPLFVNPAFCSFLGFSEQEMRHKHCVDFSPREDAEKDWVLFQRLKQGLINHYQLNKRYFRRDGSLVWGRLTLSLLSSRSAPLVIAMVEDITEQKRTEEALRDSEERLRLAQKVAGIGTFERNIRTGVNTWTEEMESMYGLPHGGFGRTRKAFEEQVHPDDRSEVIKLVERALKTGQPTSGEWRVMWPDSSVHWIAGRWQVLTDESGEPSRVVGVNMDITERKGSEERLREYEQVVESAEDMIGVVDREYRFLLANRQYLKMRNLTREQLVGRLIPEVINSELFETVIKPKLDECFKGKVVRYEERFSYPGVGGRDLLLSYFPIEGADGAIDRAACILHDITERKRAEDALRASEERFRLAARAGRMYSFDWDVTTDVVLRSSEHLDIFRLAEPLRFTHTQFVEKIHPNDRPTFFSTIAGLTPEKPTAEIIYRMQHSEGASVWLKSSGRGFFDTEGKLRRVIGMVADITDLKRAEDAVSAMTRTLIEAQEQERARIGRELHDDINQRIAMLAIELDQTIDPAEFQNRVQGFREELRQISDDVQALSHDLHSTKLEYLGFVAGMKSWCKEFAERQKLDINFRSDVQSALPLDFGRPLFRVLQEALHNAFKYSGVKRIEVQLREGSGEIHLIVSDSGHGFDVDAALQGKGLGLTSMRERIRLINGTISIESKPMGGTTIHVRVPLAVEHKEQRAAG